MAGAGIFALRPASPGHAAAERAASEAGAAASSRPNIVFIVLDTTRADRMSFSGYSRTTTPNLDDFARDAVAYRHAHSVAPWTVPSHMSMFTGLLPTQHGATWSAFSSPPDMTLGEILDRTFRFPDSERLLPQKLRHAGYATLAFSSNAWVSKRLGFDEGFDHFYEVWKESVAGQPPTVGTAAGFHKILDAWLPPFLRRLPGLELGDGARALTKLREHVASHGEPRTPFFLFFNFVDPHYPYAPPTPWRYAYSSDFELGETIAQRRYNEIAMLAGDRPVDLGRFSPFYDAEITYLDYVVGRLLGWLRERGHYDDSLIIVTSDHGEHLGEKGLFSHQFSVEEELLHVPLLIKYPKSELGGTAVDDPLVSNLDLYQTILRAAGIPAAPSSPVVSQDLHDMAAFRRDFLIAEYDYSMAYLRVCQKKFAAFPIEEQTVTRSVVFDAAGRHAFVGRDGRQTPGDGSDLAPTQQAERVLLDYLRSAPAAHLRETGHDPDPATRDRLRSLGYVD